ncbi:Ktr system potassium transporter B [Virgibacillus phasianinus]|uniref:Ktr system potassium transporter B n=1 Tax=Virgibacillus phasianinus TaxID=2017483 RepID=A0A220TZV8_9BACI|nr:TrkH family potassium uptake protein [Virgibacillus phasianinus]ASK61206.1 Ktr system potassium transporter B [Virgibacillus phasianinus]
MHLEKQFRSRMRKTRLSPSQVLGLGFLILIAVGGLLLKLPFATKMPISWIDAFFTSASATTVTGLWVVDTHTAYTLFGQIVILVLIHIGGLGFMTFAIMLIIFFGRRIGLRQRLIIQEQLQTPIGGIIKLVKRVVFFALIIEAVGVILLSYRWVPEMGFWKGIYYSIFHVVAAFNNAGFALWPDSLSGYVGDPVVNIVITLMIMTGGIGFTVLHDIWYSKNFRSLSLHSKIMIVGTIIINVVSILVIFIIEFDNPNTLGSLSFTDKWWAAYFQGISPRTAGFNTIPIGELEEQTNVWMMLIMFIGAGSVSTGGGIKLTTFIVILLAVGSFLKQKNQNPKAFGRRIDIKIVYRALAIVVTSLAFIFIAVFILLITEDIEFLPLFFEVVSAFGTVGLSMGITAKLSVIGKLVIMFMMYLGLVGPLTIMLSVSQAEKEKIRYPAENVFTG